MDSDKMSSNKAYDYGSNITNNNMLRIVMVGKTGIGKCASGNTIMGQECFESKCSPKSMTANCSKVSSNVDGQQVAVIDTPGLFDTRFGDRYRMVLFTCGDDLEGTIEDYLSDSPELQDLVSRCNSQYHVFNNKMKDKKPQVTELLRKIRTIVDRNGGSHYTNEMFQEAERAIEEEKQRILKEKEEKIRKEREEVESTGVLSSMRGKYEKVMQKINEQIQAEREEKKERVEEKRGRRSSFSLLLQFRNPPDCCIKL